MKQKTIIYYNPKLKEIARQLRKNSTLGEVLLWKKLKGKQMLGYDFHRQKPIDNYIADFFCKILMLIIEIDGGSHDFEEVQLNDIKRQKKLEELGFHILRFTEKQVRKDINSVLLSIERWIIDYDESMK